MAARAPLYGHGLGPDAKKGREGETRPWRQERAEDGLTVNLTLVPGVKLGVRGESF